MWLPAPVYESLPYCYLLGGGLFACGTLYNGPGAPGALLYLACSLISLVYGVAILLRRYVYRAAILQADNAQPA